MISGQLMSRTGSAEYEDIGDSLHIELPFAGFGSLPDDIHNDPTSIDEFDGTAYRVHNPQVFLVRDCTVRTQYGLVTLDDFLIKESKFYFPMSRFSNIVFEGERHWEISALIPNQASSAEFDWAYLGQTGIQENYYR
jgi:hypothetical protein